MERDNTAQKKITKAPFCQIGVPKQDTKFKGAQFC